MVISLYYFTVLRLPSFIFQEDSISLANFEDSDTISLGAFSLKGPYE